MLEQLAEAKKINLNSTCVPSGRLNYLTEGYRKIKVAPMLVEDPHAKIGFGIIPMLEVDRATEATLLPHRDAIEEELAGLLGPSTIFLRYYALDHICKVLGSQQWASLMLEPKPVQWPAYRGPTTPPSTGGECWDFKLCLSGSVSLSAVSQGFIRLVLSSDEARTSEIRDNLSRMECLGTSSPDR